MPSNQHLDTNAWIIDYANVSMPRSAVWELYKFKVGDIIGCYDRFVNNPFIAQEYMIVKVYLDEPKYLIRDITSGCNREPFPIKRKELDESPDWYLTDKRINLPGWF